MAKKKTDDVIVLTPELRAAMTTLWNDAEQNWDREGETPEESREALHLVYPLTTYFLTDPDSGYGEEDT